MEERKERNAGAKKKGTRYRSAKGKNASYFSAEGTISASGDRENKVNSEAVICPEAPEGLLIKAINHDLVKPTRAKKKRCLGSTKNSVLMSEESDGNCSENINVVSLSSDRSQVAANSESEKQKKDSSSLKTDSQTHYAYLSKKALEKRNSQKLVEAPRSEGNEYSLSERRELDSSDSSCDHQDTEGSTELSNILKNGSIQKLSKKAREKKKHSTPRNSLSRKKKSALESLVGFKVVSTKIADGEGGFCSSDNGISSVTSSERQEKDGFDLSSRLDTSSDSSELREGEVSYESSSDEKIDSGHVYGAEAKCSLRDGEHVEFPMEGQDAQVPQEYGGRLAGTTVDRPLLSANKIDSVNISKSDAWTNDQGSDVRSKKFCGDSSSDRPLGTKRERCCSTLKIDASSGVDAGLEKAKRRRSIRGKEASRSGQNEGGSESFSCLLSLTGNGGINTNAKTNNRRTKKRCNSQNLEKSESEGRDTFVSGFGSDGGPKQQKCETEKSYDPGLPENAPVAKETTALGNCNKLGADALNTEDTFAAAAVVASLNTCVTNSTATKKTKTPRKKREKLPEKMSNKPKRPMSAYNFFFRDERAKIISGSDNAAPTTGNEARRGGTTAVTTKKKPHGKISFENLAKVIGERWKNIDEELLRKYTQMGEEDSSRYKREMHDYYEKEYAKSRAMFLSSHSGEEEKVSGEMQTKDSVVALSPAAPCSPQQVVASTPPPEPKETTTLAADSSFSKQAVHAVSTSTENTSEIQSENDTKKTSSPCTRSLANAETDATENSQNSPINMPSNLAESGLNPTIADSPAPAVGLTQTSNSWPQAQPSGPQPTVIATMNPAPHNMNTPQIFHPQMTTPLPFRNFGTIGPTFVPMSFPQTGPQPQFVSVLRPSTMPGTVHPSGIMLQHPAFTLMNVPGWPQSMAGGIQWTNPFTTQQLSSSPGPVAAPVPAPASVPTQGSPVPQNQLQGTLSFPPGQCANQATVRGGGPVGVPLVVQTNLLQTNPSPNQQQVIVPSFSTASSPPPPSASSGDQTQ